MLKRRTFSINALDLHLASVLLDNRFHNRQAQAVALDILRLIGAHTVELLEQVRQVFLGNAITRILEA